MCVGLFQHRPSQALEESPTRTSLFCKWLKLSAQSCSNRNDRSRPFGRLFKQATALLATVGFLSANRKSSKFL